MNGSFFVNSILLGIGLAMDAFSVSVADGLREPDMSRSRKCLIAGTFAFFQCLMPLAGWALVTLLTETFHVLKKAVPWVALILLGLIGIKMIRDGLRGEAEREEKAPAVGTGTLLLQGVATSIDALSAGTVFSDYTFAWALAAGGIIAAVTFVICLTGIKIGRIFGLKLADKATVAGGIILILIGIEIFVKNLIA